uniref:KASH domain-containing protein n=1 Tax=Tetranychus urticae TaxID=32264 RepID=T1KSM6_TETUR
MIQAHLLKTEKYEITRREKREEIIGGDIVGTASKDITLHVDSTRDFIEIKDGGEGGKSGDQKISVSHFEETKQVPTKVDEMTKEEMAKVETLVEQLKQLNEWCNNNNLDALLKKELLACDESSFTKLRELREKWTHQVNLLAKLSEELTSLLSKMKDKDEQQSSNVNKLIKTVEDLLKTSFDFDGAFKVLKEAIAFRNWLNDCKCKVEQIEESIIKTTEKNVTTLETMKKDLIQLLEVIETINLRLIEKYVKIMEQVEEEKKVLTKLGNNLDLLKEKVIAKAELEAEAARQAEIAEAEAEAEVKAREEAAARKVAEMVAREAAEAAAKEIAESVSQIPATEAVEETVEASTQDDATLDRVGSEESTIPLEEVRKDDDDLFIDAESSLADDTSLIESGPREETFEEANENIEITKEESVEEVVTTMTDWKQYYNQMATWLRTNDDILDVLEEKPFTTIQSIEECITQIETMREERLTKLKQGLDLIGNIPEGASGDNDDLESKAKSDLDEIEAKLNELNDKGDKLKTKFQDIIENHKQMVEKVEELSSWMDEVDRNVANNDLKADLLEKRDKLDSLERFKKTLDSKADELKKLRQQVDQLNGLLDEQVTTLNERHETLNGSLEEAINKWTKYVNDHSGLDDLHQMCKEINAKTALRLKESEEMDDLEDKLSELNDLINSKEAKVTFERLDEQLQRVLYQTSNPARTNISNPIRDTIRERNETLNKLKSLRATTNEKFALLQQSQMALKQATKALDEIEYAIVEASLFTCSLSEKKSQWDKAKQLLRDCKLIDISSLSEKPDIAKEYAALVDRHEAALGKLHDLMESNERAYKDHQAFKESCDDVVHWMKNLKDRIPSLSAGCLSDRLSLETTISTLNDLLGRRSAGDEKLNNMKELGAIALETSSTDGKKLINRNTDNLEKDYASLLGEIEKTIEHLQVLMVELKKFKEEYEDTNEWLQSMESEIKQERTICRGSTLQEKQANVAICNKLMEQLEKGREETIGKLWKKDVLLKSHLENYIRNQLKLLESRYQVLTNLFKDVASKVNEIAENHELFHNKCQQAQNWIKNASDKLESMAGSYEGKREAIEAALKSVGEVIKRNQEEGQVCVHQALSAGEKALRSAPSQGRDVISLEIHEIQSKWDRYLNKVSETKSDLEMALIQCQEQQLARNKMKQWLKEQEARAAALKEVNSTDEYGSLKENLKSKMRKLNSLLQDLESHPDVHSVTKSSPELQSMYDQLMTGVKENINEIQTKLDQIEDFNNYCQELKDWLARSKEDLSRCSSTIENRDSINEKTALLKQLTDDEEGPEKLRAAIRCADLCKKNLTPERCSQLDEEIARLSGELDSHRAAISQVKSTLDVGLAKWAEYDTQFSKCSTWLAYIEPLLKEFTEPQANLLAKRSKLEEFQSTHLQSIFDWQTEFHILNVKAQLLLETHADSSISAAFTQLSARYNDLVASAKDVLHALQQRFQEHQQQQSILTECSEFVDKTREKLEAVRKHLSSSSLEELNTNLTKTRGMLDSLKGQGETKMSYLEDLTSKVVEHTHSDGVNDVKEDIVQLKSDFDTLLKETADTRSSFEVKIDEINQFEKIWNSVIEWFENDIEAAMGKLEKDGDKRIMLNLLRLIEKDVNTHQELIASLTEFKDKFPQADEFLTNRYHPRVEVLSETINRLIEEIKTDEKFKVACKEAQDWIKSVHVSFDGLAEKPSDKESIKQRLTMLESTANDVNLEKVRKLIVWANELGKEEDEKEFSQEVDWIMATIEEWKIKSNDCLENWINYETLYGNLLDWCTSKNQEYSNEDYPSDQVELLLNEVADKKKDFDQLNCLMDSLIPLANTSSLKEDFINLTSMYSSLVSSLRKKVEKIRTVKEAKSKFDKTEQQLSDWIDETVDAIEKSFENPSDRLNYLKGLQNTIATGSSLISSATELAARLSSEDDKLGTQAKAQLDQAKDKFDQITSQLNGEVKSLTRQLDRYEEYNTNLDSLAQWLKDNPEVFESTLSCKGDLFELKATADKLKILSTGIDKNSSSLTKLREEVGSDPRLGARIDSLIDQYNQAASNVASLLNKIEHDTNRIQSYQQLLQSIEKWLLQQSYQLMAHLSLSINTLSQCRSELAKHRKILNDIETYGALEELRTLGEEIVTECGYDREKMMSQYNNLKETFEALIGQGKRIEAQLNYALEKFEIYEQTLARCESILNERMGKDIRMEFPPLQEAVEELEKAKSVHDKLYEAKSELQAAIQGCSEATAAVSRPPSPEIPINQGLMIPEREVEIKCRLEDSLDYVKQQITSIQELIEQWKDNSEHKMGHYFIVDIVRLFRRIHRPS